MALIISMMGIDGSGKSTLANQLQKDLKLRGEKSVVVWACLRPVLLKPFILLAKRLMVKGKDKFKDYDAHMEAKRAGMGRASWTHGIYLAVMIIDYIPQVLYKVYLQRLLGKHVICDRYYHDLMMDYCAHINAPCSRVLELVTLGNRLFPLADLLYYVSVPAEVALQRKDDIPSINYLEERAAIYDAISTNQEATILDGERSAAENSARILSDIDELCS